MHTVEQYNTILKIFKYEAEKGRHELTAIDIAHHDLNKRERPKWLAFVFEKSVVFDSLNFEVPHVWSCLPEMVQLNLLRSRTVPVEIAGRTYNKIFYTRTGNLPSDSKSSSEMPKLAGA